MSLAVSFCSKKKWRVAEGCKVPHNSQTCRQEQVSGQVAPTPGRISARCGFLQKLTCWLRFQVYSPQLVSSGHSAETNLEDSAAVFLGDSEVPNTNLVNPELIRRWGTHFKKQPENHHGITMVPAAESPPILAEPRLFQALATWPVLGSPGFPTKT